MAGEGAPATGAAGAPLCVLEVPTPDPIGLSKSMYGAQGSYRSTWIGDLLVPVLPVGVEMARVSWRVEGAPLRGSIIGEIPGGNMESMVTPRSGAGE